MKTKYYLRSEDNAIVGSFFQRNDDLFEVDFCTKDASGYAVTWLFTNKDDAIKKVHWVLEKSDGKYKEA